MIDYSVRLTKRFAILLPGILIAYVSVRKIFPLFDKQLPLALAIFFTYVLGAYVLIPALIRVIRILFPPRHLPLYCVTPDGFASDPLNIGVIGSKAELVAVMEAAGWFVADPHTLSYVVRQIYSALFNRPYATAPMSRLYLFGRKQDIGFEIPVEGTRGQRHHVRFWATTYDKGKPISPATMHWQDRKIRAMGGDLLWIGAASRDTGFNFIRHNVQITHMIDPNTNKERQLIVDSLRAADRVQDVQQVRLGKAYRLINRVWLGHLKADGNMAVVFLKA